MVLVAAINLDTNEAKAYIAIAVGVLGLGYLWLRSMSKKRRDPLERAPFAGLSQQRSVERQFQNLLVEMAEMSRQISAQLDTRSQKLNLLIEEADAKIAELRSLQNQASLPTRSAGTERPVAGGASAAGTYASIDASSSTDPPARSPEVVEADTRHADVYAMAEQGHSAQDIARRLDRPRGEIELILALRSAPDSPPRRAAG
ncbi:MAG TPA: hypothetical protein PLD59_04690 [Tepidisphaeraceae bacterium]|nr:hypothetical protein [Tepidisphaeraceae bacterium]